MSVKQIRLSGQAKEQLIRLKTRTGIAMEHPVPVGVLSVSGRTDASASVEIPADSNVEMTWGVFAGEWHEVYLALLKERCARDGQDTSAETLNRQFRLHLHRGIGYLATPNRIRSIGDLAGLAAR